MTGSSGPSDVLRGLVQQRTVVAAGAFNPFVARLVEDAGYDAIYVSGAGLSNSLARADEGWLTRRQVLDFTRSITEVVSVPVIVDVDTGFGGPKATAETVRLFQKAGAAAVQIEDQDPGYKRCGHLEGKQLVSATRMASKIAAARAAQGEGGPLILARTDARAVEGLNEAIDRARRYVEAGADMVFPEAMQSREEFQAFRDAITVPLVANMTEFGKSPWMTDAEFEAMGYEVVLHPVSAFRFMAKAMREALQSMRTEGYQKPLVDAGAMMTREEIDQYLVRD